MFIEVSETGESAGQTHWDTWLIPVSQIKSIKLSEGQWSQVTTLDGDKFVAKGRSQLVDLLSAIDARAETIRERTHRLDVKDTDEEEKIEYWVSQEYFIWEAKAELFVINRLHSSALSADALAGAVVDDPGAIDNFVEFLKDNSTRLSRFLTPEGRYTSEHFRGVLDELRDMAEEMLTKAKAEHEAYWAEEEKLDGTAAV